MSDHFDGKKFFNPTLEEEFSPKLSDIFRMAKEKRPEWPKDVENSAVPRLNEKLDPDNICLTFVNHATFLIQLPGLNILTDPVWSNRVGPLSWLGIKRVREPGVKFEDLPKIDVVLISHNHYDHLDIPTLKKLNEKFQPKVLVPLGDKKLVQSIGFKDVQELDWWESVEVDTNTRITFTPTQHMTRRSFSNMNRSLWGSFFIQQNGKSVYFGGDAAYSTHFAEIQRRITSPDIALIGIGDYLPRWFMKFIHMNPAEAVIAHQDLGAKLTVAMHQETFHNSSVAFDQPSKELKEALQKEQISPDSFIIMEVGETRTFQPNCKNNGILLERE